MIKSIRINRYCVPARETPSGKLIFQAKGTTHMKLTTRSALHQNLGQYLREKRVNAGLTQAEIAGKLGYSSPQFISNFERGLCSPPLKNLKALVKLYKIDANELIRLIIDEQKNVLSHALLGKRAR